MTIPITISNGTKVYNLSSTGQKPNWKQENKKSKRSEPNKESRNSVELLQDFEFPSSCSKVCVTKDKNYLCAVGTYKPQLKVFDLDQLSIKFERHLDYDVVDFLALSEDYKKYVFLRGDRFLEFHSQFGSHYKTRIPKNGINLIYNPYNCDLVIPSTTDLAFRINLEEGKFKRSFEVETSSISSGAYHRTYNFYAFGGSDGIVECYDPRQKAVAAKLDVRKGIDNFGKGCENPMVTKISFMEDYNKLGMGVGTSCGKSILFDIRMETPLFVKDHRNELAIKDMQFCSSEKLVSCDSKTIKIWDIAKDKIFTSIIPQSDINSFCIYPNSGIIFAACNFPKVQAFFIPELGEAPKWCHFLDNITEELEESKTNTVYDDYKFVTMQELQEIDAVKLIGTDVLRPYMHGYFMNYRVYSRLKAVVTKEEMKDHLRATRQNKISKKLAEKINAIRNIPKVNKNYAKKMKTEQNLLEDERFKMIFENADYQIDVNSEEYKLRYTNEARKRK